MIVIHVLRISLAFVYGHLGLYIVLIYQGFLYPWVRCFEIMAPLGTMSLVPQGTMLFYSIPLGSSINMLHLFYVTMCNYAFLLQPLSQPLELIVYLLLIYCFFHF